MARVIPCHVTFRGGGGEGERQMTRLIIGMALATTSAQAGDYTDACRESTLFNRPIQNQFAAGHCMGLVIGSAYADPKICVPEGVTEGRVMRRVFAYIDATQLPGVTQKVITDALRQ